MWNSISSSIRIYIIYEQISCLSVYWDIWIPEIAEELVCDMHKSNDHDSHDIGVVELQTYSEVRILDFTSRVGGGGGG